MIPMWRGLHVRQEARRDPRAKLLLWLLGVSLLAGCARATASAPAPKMILVSDIDDTIKLTRVVNRGHMGSELENAFNAHGAFVGMQQVYSMLHARGVEIDYVSGAPRLISRLPTDFLEDSRFPSGEVFLRWNPFSSIEDFKVRTIRGILQQNQAAHAILIGDNGERDCASYERIREDPEIGFRVERIFIHKLYEGPPSMVLPSGQLVFVTAGELALALHADGLLTTDQLREVLVTVRDGLASPSLKTSSHTLPAFSEIRTLDVESAFGQSKWPQDEVAEQLLRDIKSRELERARGGP